MDNDCWMNVFLYLPFEHISSCLITCKQFTEILNKNNKNTYWEILVKYTYDYWRLDDNYKEKYKQFHILCKFLKNTSKLDISYNVCHQTIRKLTLKNCNLYSIPNEINLLSNIDTIHLIGNSIKIFPEKIYQLHNLKHLNISRNELESLPSDIKHLSKLRSLHLHHNNLKSLSPEIGQLTNLQNLSLSHNKLKSLPNEISKLTKLSYLGLFDNSLKSLLFDMTQFENTKFIEIEDEIKKNVPNNFFNLFL